MKYVLLALVLLLPAAPVAPALAQDKPEPLDGPSRPVRDSLLEQLAGRWRVTRQMRGTSTTVAADAEWVLSHQFLRFHYLRDSTAKQPYEAMVFIGYDNTSDRYVVHWLDVFGGRWSETLGYGTRVANGIRFMFEYPDGPFTNTFTFDPATREWTSLLRQKNPRGEWTTFVGRGAGSR